ncbi:MAG: sigma-70 family RNA polymerase sigma factor [Bariatricus sp.]|nr:sigma-70 family RNA polymerase sigma factor [Bariatricus sp.]
MIDVKQFTELYKLVYKDMYRFALCMMKNSHDAEDAVSESVLLAYENVHKLRKEEAFRSWIFQILANVCKKKLKAKERTEVPIEEEHMSEDFIDQITEDVRKAFFILSEEEQFIVALSVFAGYNSTEIGKMCKLNASTVRSKRKRALEKMKILFM